MTTELLTASLHPSQILNEAINIRLSHRQSEASQRLP